MQYLHTALRNSLLDRSMIWHSRRCSEIHPRNGTSDIVNGINHKGGEPPVLGVRRVGLHVCSLEIG